MGSTWKGYYLSSKWRKYGQKENYRMELKMINIIYYENGQVVQQGTFKNGVTSEIIGYESLYPF